MQTASIKSYQPRCKILTGDGFSEGSRMEVVFGEWTSKGAVYTTRLKGSDTKVTVMLEKKDLPADFDIDTEYEVVTDVLGTPLKGPPIIYVKPAPQEALVEVG